MFGQTGNTSSGNQSSPFSQSPFGKPITTTSFGSAAAPVFGSTNNSLFGAKPQGATSGGLFGNTTTAPAFGQPPTSQSSFGAGMTGTVVKFSPVTGNDTAMMNGIMDKISTRYCCITIMKEYEGKSVEELRSEDYTAGRNGQAQATTPASLFSSANTAQKPTTGFGTANTTVFGSFNGVQHNQSVRLFNQNKQAFNMPVSAANTTANTGFNGFTQNTATNSIFGVKPNATEIAGLSTVPSFGTPCAPVFGTGSAFGTTANTGTAFGTAANTGTTFGTTANTGTAFGIAANAGTTFGTATNTGTTFGKTTNTGTTFGTTANTGTAFGTAANAGTIFGTAANTGTSFGKTTNTGTTFGTTANTGTAFGTAANTRTSFGTAANTGTSFGKTTNTGTTFGTTANTGTAFGTAANTRTSFGTTANTGTAFGTAANAGTIFGTAANTGTSFGKTTNTGTTFGTTANTGTAFGTAANTGATFGTAAKPRTALGMTANTGTSLVGSSLKPAEQPGSSYGFTAATSTRANTGLPLGTGSSMFGQPQPGGFFGNTENATFNNQNAFTMGSNFGANNNAILIGLGTIAGIGVNLAQQNSMQPQILAMIATPFGDSPLFKNLLPASAITEDVLTPANARIRTWNSPQYEIAPNNNSPKVEVRAVTNTQPSKKLLLEELKEEDSASQEAFQPRANAKRLVLRPKAINATDVQSPDQVITTLNTKESQSSKENVIEIANKENHQQTDTRRPADDGRSSTSCLKRKNESPEDEFKGHGIQVRGSEILKQGLDNTVTESGTQNKLQSLPLTTTSLSVNDEALNNSSKMDKSIMNSSHNSDTSHELDETPVMLSQTQQEPNAACITLQRAGYYTIPPLDKLDEYVCGDTCIVPNFTIGRKGYGNVYFPDQFDIYGLNLDEIVHFHNKEVIIYPDDDQKPPIGQGLNRKAQVTLDRVWPQDKTLHKAITDPQRISEMNYEEKLRRVSTKHDTKFLEYRPETGSWVFTVDHFSKFGLSDSDDENETSPNSDLMNDTPPNSGLKKLKAIRKMKPKLTCPMKQTIPPIDSLEKKQHQISLVKSKL